jgi:hypothetical protein
MVDLFFICCTATTHAHHAPSIKRTTDSEAKQDSIILTLADNEPIGLASK